VEEVRGGREGKQVSTWVSIILGHGKRATNCLSPLFALFLPPPQNPLTLWVIRVRLPAPAPVIPGDAVLSATTDPVRWGSAFCIVGQASSSILGALRAASGASGPRRRDARHTAATRRRTCPVRVPRRRDLRGGPNIRRLPGTGNAEATERCLYRSGSFFPSAPAR
jgi:hypothetical protein